VPAGLAAGLSIAAFFVLNSNRANEVEGLLAQLMHANHRLNGEIQHRTQVQAELAAARDEALELARLKSEFVATMSQEIRTPMNGIIGMTDLLLETGLTDEQRDFAGIVRESSDNLMVIIDDILDFAKIEAGALNLQLVEFTPRAILADALDSLVIRAEAKGLKLRYELSKDIPEMVIGDPARLRQMLVIMTGNAIKFTDRGEVSVSAQLGAWTEASVTLRIKVRDTGVSVNRENGGAALGLAICKKLAGSMHGGVEVESWPGKGSTSQITLSLDLPENSRNQRVNDTRGELVESQDLVQAGVGHNARDQSGVHRVPSALGDYVTK